MLCQHRRALDFVVVDTSHNVFIESWRNLLNGQELEFWNSLVCNLNINVEWCFSWVSRSFFLLLDDIHFYAGLLTNVAWFASKWPRHSFCPSGRLGEGVVHHRDSMPAKTSSPDESEHPKCPGCFGKTRENGLRKLPVLWDESEERILGMMKDRVLEKHFRQLEE